MTERSRLESNRKQIRTESFRNPGVPESGLGREGSFVGDGGVGEGDRQWTAAITWAVQHLPDEHPPLVAAAYLTTRLNGKPSAAAIRQRLAHQGRDAATLRALTEGARK